MAQAANAGRKQLGSQPVSNGNGHLPTLETAAERIAGAFDAARHLTPAYKPNARTVFLKRYARKDDAGEPIETPAEAVWRVALNVASVTVLYVPGAEWQSGDVEPQPVQAETVELPFRTIVRQYNWLLAQGRKLKEFTALVHNGLDAWLDRAYRYYDLLAKLHFVPNSPTWTGAGTPLGQLAACFVLPVEDSLVLGESSIMDTLQNAVAIQKTGGGNGFSFGRLRPAGSVVRTSMGAATGVVGFLRMYNGVFEEIRQGGSRRGANMGVCPVWHPDVIDFINAKTVEGQVANFNISVGITEAFMAAVDAGKDWEFHFPGPEGPTQSVKWQGQQVSRVPARELFELIIRNAHVIGDPGALFLDEANRYNPCPKWYELESTNPCGEQWLGPYENCCLGSIAVQNFVRDDGSFDWDEFRSCIELSTEFLDDVVDANNYVATVPELEVAAQGGRRIGLGLMGLADALIKLGYRYGASDGLDAASQVAEFMRYHAMRTSVRRAAERGAFEWIPQSVYDPKLLTKYGAGHRYEGRRNDGRPFSTYLWQPPQAQVEHRLELGRPELMWGEVLTGIQQSGIRNSCQTTFAPTGTIATTAGVEGYGCEPVFALAYTRTVMQEQENLTLAYASDLFKGALVKAGLSEEQITAIAEEVVANGGSCQGLASVPPAIQYVFVVAADLPAEEHVRTQGALQAWVDNSISKTINLANTATVEDVERAYRLAHELHCKGITIYRQGSRELEVLTTQTKTAAPTGAVEVVDSEHWPVIRPLPIPAEAEIEGMDSRTYTSRTPFGKMRATLTNLESHRDRIFDVEVGIGRGGSDVNAFTEALGRVISVALRAGVPADEIADQLIGIGGSTQEQTLRPDKALSLPDALGKLLLHHKAVLEAKARGQLVSSVVVKQLNPGLLCPECHQANLVQAEGCTTCQTAGCGYSKCG